MRDLNFDRPEGYQLVTAGGKEEAHGIFQGGMDFQQKHRHRDWSLRVRRVCIRELFTNFPRFNRNGGVDGRRCCCINTVVCRRRARFVLEQGAYSKTESTHSSFVFEGFFKMCSAMGLFFLGLFTWVW